ncbi:hypothetical protein DFH27DRAFT_176006 [Peziza echinospora]|nr:hypothetical protein DFH27DRAFT_176006 [Peziza echinospora]
MGEVRVMRKKKPTTIANPNLCQTMCMPHPSSPPSINEKKAFSNDTISHLLSPAWYPPPQFTPLQASPPTSSHSHPDRLQGHNNKQTVHSVKKEVRVKKEKELNPRSANPHHLERQRHARSFSFFLLFFFFLNLPPSLHLTRLLLPPSACFVG